MNKMSISVSGVTWEQVTRALGEGMHNMSTRAEKRAEVNAFLANAGILGPRIFVARHSIGKRDWTRRAGGTEPLFLFEEPEYPSKYEGWDVLMEESASYVFLGSATSESTLEAFWEEGEGAWTVILEVPIKDDGKPYRGRYWMTFFEAFPDLLCKLGEEMQTGGDRSTRGRHDE